MPRHEDDDADGLIAPDLRLIYVDPDDLSAYERIDPAEFEDFDQVDSTTIVDPGAPLTDNFAITKLSVNDDGPPDEAA